MKTKVEIKFDTKDLEQSVNNAISAFENLSVILRKIDRRTIFEKAIDWVSYKLFGGKSCMPNELRSF